VLRLIPTVEKFPRSQRFLHLLSADPAKAERAEALQNQYIIPASLKLDPLLL